jgi:hypothetical protein
MQLFSESQGLFLWGPQTDHSPLRIRAPISPLTTGVHENVLKIWDNFIFCADTKKNRGHTMTQLVEALRYKPEGRGFDSRWCHWPWGRLSL